MGAIKSQKLRSSKIVERQADWVVYTAQSRLKKTVQLCKTLWRDLLASRELAWQLLVRDWSVYRVSMPYVVERMSS